MPSSTSSSPPLDMKGMVFMLLDQVDSMLQPLRKRIVELESTIQSLSATPPPAPLHQASKLSSSKDHLVAPTSTPTSSSPSTSTPSIKINSLSSKAAFVKTAVSLLVPDDQAGHVVGRSGAGLKQIHDFSGAKITVTPGSNADGFRTIIIRGNAREVGDAVNAIGKRLAHRRVRVKKQHATTNLPSNPSPIPPQQLNSGASVSSPSQKSASVPIPISPPQKHIPMVVPPPWVSVSTPSSSQKPSASVSHSPSTAASKPVVTPSSSSKPNNSPTPMSIVTPTPIDSPMHLDVTEARPISTAIRSKPMPKKYRNKKKGGG